MKYRIIFNDRAYTELEEAVLYYEMKRKGLGESFFQEVEQIITVLARAPELFTLRYRNTREVMVNRYPYLIVYEIERDTVLIYSIFHTSRRPDKKYKRRF